MKSPPVEIDKLSCMPLKGKAIKKSPKSQMKKKSKKVNVSPTQLSTTESIEVLSSEATIKDLKPKMTFEVKVDTPS